MDVITFPLNLKNFARKKGIEHEVITPDTPKHNGIVERKNISILNIARSMLKAKNMPTRR